MVQPSKVQPLPASASKSRGESPTRMLMARQSHSRATGPSLVNEKQELLFHFDLGKEKERKIPVPLFLAPVRSSGPRVVSVEQNSPKTKRVLNLLDIFAAFS